MQACCQYYAGAVLCSPKHVLARSISVYEVEVSQEGTGVSAWNSAGTQTTPFRYWRSTHVVWFSLRRLGYIIATLGLMFFDADARLSPAASRYCDIDLVTGP